MRPAVRGLLIDLSGTLHVGSNPTPSAADALHRLRKARIPFRLCSNTSKECTRDLTQRLSAMGFDVREGELWTSLGALRDIVKVRGMQRPYCLLSKSAMEEFPEFDYIGDVDTQAHTEYDSVVVGLAPELFTYDRLTTAFRILISSASATSPATFLTTHRAKYIRTPDGELSLGPGPFVAALEDAASPGVRAEAVGKPTKAFFERVLGSLQDELLRDGSGARDDASVWDGVAVVGDDVHTDLGEGALELGLWRVLVQTGKYRPGDETRAAPHPPDEVQPSFAAFVDDILSN